MDFEHSPKAKARAAGLWNLFLPESKYGAGLTNLEYAPLAEIMGRSPIGSEPFNCSAPDTGNMETLVRYGSQAQQQRWLPPLLDGRIRSAFAMTEPGVASSDATNIEASIRRDGDHYVINGRKWWTSGANDPRCEILIFMGKTDPDHVNRHQQQSMILVPMDTPGVKVLRHLPVFGYDDAPHGHAEVDFVECAYRSRTSCWAKAAASRSLKGVWAPAASITACAPSAAPSARWERIAQSRILIDQARWLVLHAAWKMDKVGNKDARREIAMIKVAAPAMALQVIDWAMQVHGGAAVSDDFGLARAYASTRTLRLADGPDEVHRNAIAKIELARHLPPRA